MNRCFCLIIATLSWCFASTSADRCLDVWPQLAKQITTTVHNNAAWEGCHSYACQMHLALQLYAEIEVLQDGIESEVGMQLDSPAVLVARYCSPQQKEKKQNDAIQLLGLLRKAVQINKAVHVVSWQLAHATANGHGDIFHVGQRAYLEGDWEGAIAWLMQALRHLPPSQLRNGPDESDVMFFKYNDIYDYLSASYAKLSDLHSTLVYGRAFEVTCPKGDSEYKRARANMDFILGAASAQRMDAYEDMCSQDVTFPPSISPALSMVGKFGYFMTSDMRTTESFRMRIDDGGEIWATKISRPPGAPNITLLHSILSDSECDHLISLAAPQMFDAIVVDPDTGESKVDTYRTSKGAWLDWGSDPAVDRINIRLAALTNKGLRSHEELHVVHYKEGQEYEPHYDFSDANRDKDDWSVTKLGNRIVTIIMYLKSPESGGDTVFPISRLKVSPKKGDAVMFTNLHQNSFADHLTMHGGCPPTKGEKWIATKWIREHNHPAKGGDEEDRTAISTTTGQYAW